MEKQKEKSCPSVFASGSLSIPLYNHFNFIRCTLLPSFIGVRNSVYMCLCVPTKGMQPDIRTAPKKFGTFESALFD